MRLVRFSSGGIKFGKFGKFGKAVFGTSGRVTSSIFHFSREKGENFFPEFSKYKLCVLEEEEANSSGIILNAAAGWRGAKWAHSL